MTDKKSAAPSEGAAATPRAEDDDRSTGSPAAFLGPNFGGMGQATKARYIPLEEENAEAEWGIVHLYRESDEASALKVTPASLQQGGSSLSGAGTVVGDEEQTLLCIPLVPGYINPADFLHFIGEKFRADVGHYRMVTSSDPHGYMVIMKLRDPRRATEWQRQFDGKPFVEERPKALCKLVFIKSITVEMPEGTISKGAGKKKQPLESSTSAPNSGDPVKTLSAPTPDLTELPTCTVCLERMDDTAELVTIPCQHVFHCKCLMGWRGSGCPLCRATTLKTGDPDGLYSSMWGSGISNLCMECDTDEDLWLCLSCGNVGCGRYKGGHAKAHWQRTKHSYSLEVETQYVWDYLDDSWVHRLIRDKPEKSAKIEPSRAENTTIAPNQSIADTGQGEAQTQVQAQAETEALDRRIQETVNRLIDEQFAVMVERLNNERKDLQEYWEVKAATAELRAKRFEAIAGTAAELKEELRVLKKETIPALEKDKQRLEKDNERQHKNVEAAKNLARNLQKALEEEKEMSMGLSENLIKAKEEIDVLKQQLAEEQEMNRDLMMNIQTGQQLAKMEEAGQIDKAELEEGSIQVGPGPSNDDTKKGKGKGKGRGKGKN